jgi:hypothetical protein
MRPLRRGLSWWSFFVKSESLVRGGVITMTPTDNLDSCLQWCVGFVSVLAGFPLIKRPTLFFLINKNESLLPRLRKKNLHWKAN